MLLNPRLMKKLLFMTFALLASGFISAQTGDLKPITLSKPNLDRGKNIMQALSERKSTRQFDSRELSLSDLSDLMWAANGINRPDGRRTAPSAMNRQDIELYVCMKGANYHYDPKGHKLVPVSAVEARPLPEAPVCIILVGLKDFSLSPVDAGIVSQNISLFCSGVGLATVCRATQDQAALKKALALDDNRVVIVNHPVGYFKK